MALELKLKRGAVLADLSEFILMDNTGVYDAVDNPTGFGVPNPERNTIALFLYGYKYRANSDDEALVLNNSADPLLVSQWDVPISEDGYYYFRMLGIPIWEIATPYAVGDIVYHSSRYYIALDVSTGVDPLTDPLTWEEITDLTTDAIFGNPSIYVTSSDQVLNYRAKACYQTQVQLEAEGCCDCHTGSKSKVKIYQKIFVHLTAASFDCLQQKYPQADAELAFLSEFCASIACPHC